MKYLLAMGVLILAIGLVAWLYVSKTEVEQNLDNIEAVEVASEVEVTPLSADVSISADSSNWGVITEPKKVSNGTTVQTSADGRAIITNEAAIISSLDNNSEITLALTDGKRKSSLALLKGRVWSKIARALEQDEVFEVYTPTMVAAARGTSFGVSLDKKRTLIVTEGVVYVVQRNPETGERDDSTAIEVSAGNTLEDDGENFVVRPTSSQDKDSWYEENNSVKIASEIQTPTRETPASNNPDPVQVTNPNSDPVVPVKTTTAPPSLSSVSPDRFDYEKVSDIRISGSNLSNATELLFNGNRVEFIVTSTGLLVVSTSELRDGYDTYDIKVTTPDGSDTLNEAFENEFQGIELSITEAVMEYGQTENTYIAIRGVGMEEVDTVLVGGQGVPFTVTSSTELRVNYSYVSMATPVEVRSGNQSATATVYP